jgi:hypothetical protein
MPVYRPSASIRLSVRLDEGRRTTELLARLEPVATGQDQAGAPGGGGANTSRTEELSVLSTQVRTLHELNELSGGSDPALRIALERAQSDKRAAAEAAHGAGPGIDASNPDGLTITIGSLPVIKAEIERSHFRAGDKATFTLNYWDCPFDPRKMRAAAVEVLIGVVSAEEHDAGMHGLTREDGSRYSVVEDVPGVGRDTRFLGFVTKWDVEFGEDGATVRGQAEDLTGLLRDTPMPADVEIDHDQPLERGIKGLLERFPALRHVEVVFGEGTGEAGPKPGTAAARRKKTVKKGKKRIRRNAEQSSVLDHITDVCVGTGMICVVDGLRLKVTNARTLFGPQAGAPRMVWGKNLTELSFARTMAGYKHPTVEVRSYQVDKRRTYAARYPDLKHFGIAILGVRDFPVAPQRPSRVPHDGKKPDEPIRVVPVYDVRPEVLPEIARGIYEETARQEIEGTFSTSDPASFGRDFAAANLLDLRAADSIEIVIDTRGQGEVADAVTRLHSMGFPERVAHLEASGYQRKVAVAYAALLDASDLQTLYRVATVRLRFDQEEGLDVAVDFMNYIIVRDDPHAAAVLQNASKQALSRARGSAGPAAARLKDKSAARRTADARARADGTAPAPAEQRAAESFEGGLSEELEVDAAQGYESTEYDPDAYSDVIESTEESTPYDPDAYSEVLESTEVEAS